MLRGSDPVDVQSVHDRGVYKRCSTVLATLVTESWEDDPYTSVPLVRDGISRNIETSKMSRTHLLHSGLIDTLVQNGFHPEEDLILFAAHLRLWIFSFSHMNNDHSPARLTEVASAVRTFFRAANTSKLKHLRSEDLLIVLNTAIYAGIRNDLAYEPTQTGDRPGSKDLPPQVRGSWNVLMSATEPQLSNLRVWSQICWGIWLLSTTDLRTRFSVFSHAEPLIPIFNNAHIKNLYGPITELLTQRQSQWYVLSNTLRLLNCVVDVKGDHRDEACICVFKAFLDSFEEMVKQLCSPITPPIDPDYLPFRLKIAKHSVHLWLKALEFQQRKRKEGLGTTQSALDVDALNIDFSSLFRVLGTLDTAVDAYRATSRAMALYLASEVHSFSLSDDVHPKEVAMEFLGMLRLLERRLSEGYKYSAPLGDASRGFFTNLLHACDPNNTDNPSIRQTLLASYNDIGRLLEIFTRHGVPGAKKTHEMFLQLTNPRARNNLHSTRNSSCTLQCSLCSSSGFHLRSRTTNE